MANNRGIFIKFNFPDKSTVEQDVMNVLKNAKGQVNINVKMPSVSDIQNQLQKILNEVGGHLDLSSDTWFKVGNIDNNLTKVERHLARIGQQIQQVFNVKINDGSFQQLSLGLDSIANKTGKLQNFRQETDEIYASCKNAGQAISTFMESQLGANIGTPKAVSMASNIGKQLNTELREAFNNKDLQSFVQSAQRAYSEGIDKSLSQTIGKDTLENLKSQYKSLIDSISKTQISLKNIGISKESETKLREAIKGYATINNTTGTSLDSMVQEWRTIAQQQGLNLFNTGNMEDAIDDLSTFISEYKNLKKGVLPSSVNSFGLNAGEEEKELERVEEEAKKLYIALENIKKAKNRQKATPISDNAESQKVQKTTKDIQKEAEELEKLRKIRANLNQSNYGETDIMLNKSYDTLQARAKEIQQTMNGIKSITFSKNSKGEETLNKAVIKYKNNLGQVVTETMGWKKITDETGEAIGKVFTTIKPLQIVDNKEQQEKTITQLTEKLNKLRDSGKIQESSLQKVFQNLEKVDLSNLEKAQQQINSLQKTISKLESNQPKITSLEKIKQQYTDFQRQLKSENIDIFKGLKKSDSYNKLSEYISNLNKQLQSLKKGYGSVKTSDVENSVKNIQSAMKTVQQEFNKGIGTEALMNKARVALNSFKQLSSQLNTNVVADLQKQFDKFSTKSSTQEIQNFINKIQGISKNSSQITSIENKMNDLQTKMKGLELNRGGSSYFTNNDVIQYFNNYKNKLEELKQVQEQLKKGEIVDSAKIEKAKNETVNAYKVMTDHATAFYNASKGQTSSVDAGVPSKYDNLVSNFEKLNKANLNNTFIQQLDSQIKALGKDLSQDGILEKIKSLQNVISNAKPNSNSFNTLNNKLKDMKSNLEILQNKFGGVIPPKASSQLANYKQAMSQLETAMQKLASGQKVESITPYTSQATRAVRELNAVTGNTIVTQRNLGQSISNTLSKFGIYTSMAIVCRRLFQEIKEGVQYVKYLDDSFTDMKMTMTITTQEFETVSTQIDAMAKQMGTTIESVHDIARIYSNANTTTQEILEKTKPTAEFANISGMDGLTATKNMQDIANQFKLLKQEGADASEVFTNIGNAMTAVSKNMTYDFAKLVGELM